MNPNFGHGNAHVICSIQDTFTSILSLRHMRWLSYKHTYSSHSSGLGGVPPRCEECDGIIGSGGLSQPITQQSRLVLIFLWKHPAWKWCRKQQVAHQAARDNPAAPGWVHFPAPINTNTLLCLAGSCTHSATLSQRSGRFYQWLRARSGLSLGHLLIGQAYLTFWKHCIQYLKHDVLN